MSKNKSRWVTFGQILIELVKKDGIEHAKLHLTQDLIIMMFKRNDDILGKDDPESLLRWERKLQFLSFVKQNNEKFHSNYFAELIPNWERGKNE